MLNTIQIKARRLHLPLYSQGKPQNFIHSLNKITFKLKKKQTIWHIHNQFIINDLLYSNGILEIVPYQCVLDVVKLPFLYLASFGLAC